MTGICIWFLASGSAQGFLEIAFWLFMLANSSLLTSLMLRVYLTGKGVTVFDPGGNQIDHISIPEGWTANVCFGGKDGQTLFVTASKGLYAVRMSVKGVGSQ